ncbi:hypothetical protein Tco_0966491 [Tanacetum coccineum]
MEAHCVNLELKYQNQALKEGQHGQFLKVKSNEAKVKHDIDVIETINIELEHKVAKLLKENETLKRHYKEMFDSIKTTRAKNIEHTTSLIANNDKFKAQLQEKGFAIAALKMINSRAKVPSHKTTTRYKPVEQTSVAKKPERQIPKRHKSSIKKTSVVHEKTMTPRSCLRWKPTGKIFKTVGLRWVPTGKIFTYSTTNVDSEPQNGSKRFTNQYECKQTLDVSAGTLNIHAGTSLNPTKEGLRVSGLALPRQMTSDHNSSELGIHDHSNELSSSKLVPKLFLQQTRQLHHDKTVNKSPTHYPCDSARTFRVILFSIHNDEWKSFQCHHQTTLRSYALSWKPCQGDSLNLPDHRILRRMGDGDASFQLESIHYHMLMLKLQRHTISIKIQESRKLKIKDKDFHKL